MGPLMDVGRNAARQVAEEAGGSDDHLGHLDRGLGPLGETVPAIFTHPDDGQPVAHAAPRARALMTDAAMAEPPRRPSNAA